MKEFTRKQEAFIHEYLKDFNATQAAIRAGYSKRWASEIGFQLLQKNTVFNAIKQMRDEINHQMRMKFLQDALKARKILNEIMTDPNSSNRDKIVAAKDFLDRAGFKPTDKRELSGSNSKAIEILFVEPSNGEGI